MTVGGRSVDLLLPCRNELPALEWLLPRVPSGINVILCDNGSTDGSKEFALAYGAQVVSVPTHREVGAAVSAGISLSNAEFVCVMDCDGTVDPEEITALLIPLAKGEADFVLGERVASAGATNFRQRLLTAARNRVVRREFRSGRFGDLGSARAFARVVLEGQGTRTNARYGWNLSATLVALETVGASRIGSVRVRHHPRIGRSQISGSFVGALIATWDSCEALVNFRRAKLSKAAERRRRAPGTPCLLSSFEETRSIASAPS